MSRSSFQALSISVAAALLAGCGGSQTPLGATGAPNASADSLMNHKTFRYTGRKESFEVPGGVAQLRVIARGASGAGTKSGGYGGRVTAVVSVRPYETLFIFVGGSASGRKGGFSGGADSPNDVYSDGFGGGGASDVREGGDQLSNRIVVAAGGGGDGGPPFYYDDIEMAGGEGGGLIGGAGSGGGTPYREYGDGGSGGTQIGGGDGGAGATACDSYLGAPGKNGARGKGGRGGGSPRRYLSGGGGGGGGGGYYGGGGGGSGCAEYPVIAGGGGGGGGSSYAEPKADNVRMWRGWKNATGNGLVVISW